MRSRHDRHQLALDLFGGVFRGQAQPFRQPLDVCVDHDPKCDPEGGAENDICRFPTDACECRQLVQGWRNFTIVTADDLIGHRHQTASLAKKPVERISASSSAGSAFARLAGSGKRRNTSGVTKLTREFLCMRGEDGRHHELIRIHMRQGTSRLGIGLLEPGDTPAGRGSC